jgi:hypothetical protein
VRRRSLCFIGTGQCADPFTAIKVGISITPSASVSLDVDTNVHASMSIGAVAAGTIIPPKITEFGLDFGALYHALGSSQNKD